MASAAPLSSTGTLTCELIRCPSLTPDDAGCQDILASRLEGLGFTIERLRFGEVANLWARRGHAEPLFVFAGHTDVVPAGPFHHWQSAPFEPTLRNGELYGRGAADMKGSLAAMVTACERFVATHAEHRGSIGFLLTSDEEGPAVDGTVKVVETLQARHETIAYCLVGEPSSVTHLGDIIKNGRRGSLHGRLLLKGLQGHVAYPHLVRNPIHVAGPIIATLSEQVWDEGNAFFPPTSFQISNIHAGTGATNVVPGELELLFNFRFSTAVTVEALQHRVQRLIDIQLLNEEVNSGRIFHYELNWTLGGQPYLTEPSTLVEATVAAIHETLGVSTQLSTSGGTSDGRFIAPTGAQVVELGPLNATIHQIDERVSVADLDRLSQVYEDILVRLLT
ncbi:MAG: succinyl-diaminopimelate desuccinylase [Candidatus Competibacteraceae bacterium]